MSDQKEVTIYDIAKELNLSPATVSRSLNDSTLVKKSTKEKVRRMAHKMGYSTNLAALSLRTKHTKTLGVIVPRLNNSDFVPAVIAGIENVANKAGYNLIIAQSQESSKKEILNAETMFSRRVDGLIVALAFDTVNLDHFEPFFNNNIPVIFYDRIGPNKRGINVIIDNFKAGYEATQHLIEQGYCKIAHITGDLSRNVYNDRLLGYKKALEEHGIPFDPAYVILNELTETSSLVAAKEILEMDPLPDAVFIANDRCAAICIRYFKDHGVQVPDDIGVVGFNNDPIGKLIEPKLSTIDYPGYHMGEISAKSLIGLLKKKNPEIKDKIIRIDHKLLIRDSSVRKN